MASLDERLARYRERFCFVDQSYCIQQPDGHYLRAYADPRQKERPLPLTDEMLERHLRGQQTLAFYTAKREGSETLCREGIMESDDKRAIPDPAQPGHVRYEPANGRELMRAAHLRLAREGIPSVLELSRRGARIRIFAAEPVPARAMQNLLLFALPSEERARMARRETAVEINPKQADLREGQVGNSVRGPFGLHLKSGERYPFIHPDGRPVAPTLGGQMDYALGVPAVDVLREVEKRPWLEQERSGILDRPAHEPVREQTVERRPWTPGRFGPSPIEQWKETHPLAVVLASYGVEAERSGTYHCPLPHHGDGDRRPSLSVDLDRNVWFCHTAGIGGSALDLVMVAEGLHTPSEALAYLRGRGEIELVGARGAEPGRGAEWGDRG